MNKRQKKQIESSSVALKVIADVPNKEFLAELRRGRDRAMNQLEIVDGLIRTQGMPHLRLRRKRPDVETGANERAREAIRTEHLLPIAVRARPLFKHQPDVMKGLIVPPGHASILKHAEAALAMANALKPVKRFCLTEGFPPTFLEDLRAAGQKLHKTATESITSRAKRQYSTEQLPVAIRELRRLTDIVNAEVKRLVLREGRGHLPMAIAYTWASVYKVGKPKGRPRKRNPRKDHKKDETPPDAIA